MYTLLICKMSETGFFRVPLFHLNTISYFSIVARGRSGFFIGGGVGGGVCGLLIN